MFFLSKYGGESHNRNEGLDFACAMGHASSFCRNAHRSADQGAVMVDATAPVCFQCWTGIIAKLCDQPVDLLIGPIVEKIGVSQLWEGSFHCGGVFDGTLFDTMAVVRREVGESLLEGVDVEEGNRKVADATAGAAESAGNFTEQGSSCPLEPVVSFLIQRSRVGRS